MSIAAGDITIAITVYNRRQYLKQAIKSALKQTVPVKVIVVEDCGPDATLEKFVKDEFGGRVEYFRNPERRGLFGNWNACIEYCKTPWLSILHDDDFLLPEFIETMQGLKAMLPDRGLYFGQALVADVEGEVMRDAFHRTSDSEARPLEAMHFLWTNPFSFPGHLFAVDLAKKVGGFRTTSIYSGDWEFWMKLTVQGRGARTGTPVAVFRHHDDWNRGTNRVLRSGRTYGLYAVQRKRNVALLNKKGCRLEFDRIEILRMFPLPSRYLIQFGKYFSPRLLAYNAELLLHSQAPNWKYRSVQSVVRFLGPTFIRFVSVLFNLCIKRSGKRRGAIF